MRLVPRGMGPTLFLAFSATALPILLAVGLLLEWQARKALEGELARRVESLAVTVAAAIPGETWRLLFSLGPGEEQSRTASHLRSRLERIAREVGAEQIAVWTTEGRLILDSSARLRIGSVAPRAALLERELQAVRGGATASTPLFQSESGRPVKIGLAPIAFSEEASAPRGVLLVGAPSGSLGAIAGMRRTLLIVGAVGWLLVLVVALWLSRGLTRRITRLAQAARRIGSGDLESRVPTLGEDELGILADALEGMRDAVRVRERQLRAMVGGVAHEIRNPLGGLTLSAEMLARDGRLSDEQNRRAQRILDEALRLERVVSEFLEYARPERPRRSSVALEAALTESARNAAAGLGWKGELRIDVGSESVACDPDHLRQVLLNLLRNAMQAAGGDGAVRARVRREGRDIELLIEDSGRGIPEQDRERIFEPFYSGKPQGAGLGLAIAKKLCDLGEIRIGVGRSDMGGALLRLRFRHHPGQ